MTGKTDLKAACDIILAAGANSIIATHKDGVMLCRRGVAVVESSWGEWRIEGRTGRGDTVTAAFVAASLKGLNDKQALDYAAAICSKKMMKPGPYWGEK